MNQQDSLSLHLRIKFSIIHLYIQTDCGTPPTIVDGTVGTPSPGTEYLATASVTCNTGYTLAGGPSIECLDTGLWSTGHTCTIKGKWRWCSSCRNSDYKSCVSHYAIIGGKTQDTDNTHKHAHTRTLSLFSTETHHLRRNANLSIHIVFDMRTILKTGYQ